MPGHYQNALKFTSLIIPASGNRISQNGLPLSLIWRVFTFGPWSLEAQAGQTSH
jgi:hypothetical protein